MKRIFIILSLFLISVSMMAKTPEMKATLEQVETDIYKYCNIDKKYPVKYDKVIDMAYVTIPCPGLWKGDVNYPTNNIQAVMDQYANITMLSPWTFDLHYEVMYAEYGVNIGEEVSYNIVMTYFIFSNALHMVIYQF